jgi:hypothetical protein
VESRNRNCFVVAMASSGLVSFAKAISILLGWIYVFAWSLSFYPQVVISSLRVRSFANTSSRTSTGKENQLTGWPLTFQHAMFLALCPTQFPMRRFCILPRFESSMPTDIQSLLYRQCASMISHSQRTGLYFASSRTHSFSLPSGASKLERCSVPAA